MTNIDKNQPNPNGKQSNQITKIHKMSVGKPPIIKSRKHLIELIDNYFKSEPKPTLSGLAYYIGMSRQSLYNYNKREKYFDVIQKARNYISKVYEERLLYSNKPTGVIFALKNMGWKDTQQIDQTTRHVIPIMDGVTKDITPDKKALK